MAIIVSAMNFTWISFYFAPPFSDRKNVFLLSDIARLPGVDISNSMRLSLTVKLPAPAVMYRHRPGPVSVVAVHA